ncbi:MAG: hypothetical protein GWP08_13015 [Nitrospiraceae bacterium]|nr:hypothetical protein [Nitrospiraceae bacterium]
MLTVSVLGACAGAARLCRLGNRVQSRFLFVNGGGEACVQLRLMDGSPDAPYWADPAEGVVVSTEQSEGIAHYAGIRTETYLLTCGVLGLLHWRALVLNPLIVWEDFALHETAPGCLCAERRSLQAFALAFEAPHVCRACLEFFRCLGAEMETSALLHVLDQVAREQFGVELGASA